MEKVAEQCDVIGKSANPPKDYVKHGETLAAQSLCTAEAPYLVSSTISMRMTSSQAGFLIDESVTCENGKLQASIAKNRKISKTIGKVRFPVGGK